MVEVIRGPLWDNSSSSYNGHNDRVEEIAAGNLRSSLTLVDVADLQVSVAFEGAAFGNAKRKVRGRFSLNGQTYWLAITDPMVERRYLAGRDGVFEVGRAVLCISLGEPYGGFAYKLIAGIILPGQA
jgi:hypothetical protein